MTPIARDRPRASAGFRAVALVALASLSCTTVRVPASGIPSSVKIRGDVAEPQVELWVESGKDVTPAEAEKAAAEARAALEQALAGRTLGDGGQLLVVRAQGVSRTGSRKADQRAAVAGLVVASIAIVAVAVVALVATAKSGGGGKAPSAHPAPAPGARPAPPPGGVATPPPAPAPAAVPRPTPGAVPRPTPAPGAPHVVAPPPRPAPGPGHGEVTVAFGVDVQIPVPPPNGPPPAVWSESVVTGPPPPPPPPPEPAPGEIVLPPPPPFDVEKRGFFAGDSTRLELTIVDRATARPLRVKIVESKDDPRNAAAMRALVDRALADPGGWEPAQQALPAEAPGA